MQLARFRRSLLAALALLALGLPACESGGNFTLFGYTTRPNYDPTIHKVYVPIFKNLTFWRGIEFDLTRAVVREIESKTTFKVVSNCDEADTELRGTIVSFNKNILNRNQFNEVREAETTLAVEVIWRNRRTGEILSQPRLKDVVPVAPSLPPQTGFQGPISVPPNPGPATAVPPPGAQPLPSLPTVPTEGLPPPPPGPPKPPVLVQSIGGFIPELGQSLTTAQQQNVNRLATQIVSMMEVPW